jgi:hypothetical protein
LPVATITANVSSTCAALSSCSHQWWPSRASTALTHTAQAKCSDGIAAIWLACSPTGEPHDPQVWPSRTVSTKPWPGTSRGGAVGHSAKQLIATRLSSTKELRAGRYSSGRRASSQASRINALSTYVVAYS